MKRDEQEQMMKVAFNNGSNIYVSSQAIKQAITESNLKDSRFVRITNPTTNKDIFINMENVNYVVDDPEPQVM